jgi:hypothetical protein
MAGKAGDKVDFRSGPRQGQFGEASAVWPSHAGPRTAPAALAPRERDAVALATGNAFGTVMFGRWPTTAHSMQLRRA